jgi:hypothetical protein
MGTRYMVLVGLEVEADGEDQERSIEKSVAGVLEGVVVNDEPPHMIVGFTIDKVFPVFQSKHEPRRTVSAPDYGEELVLVEDGPYEVRAPSREGVVFAEYVRVVDVNEDREEVYWNLEEIAETIRHSSEDPGTAFNALLSAIELVRTGQYPPHGFDPVGGGGGSGRSDLPHGQGGGGD